MNVHVLPVVAAIAGLACAGVAANAPAARPQDARADSRPAPRIPASVATEHHAIHESLEQATRAPGRVGASARTLAETLHPHFVREEEIALPPLALLAPLARGERTGDTDAMLAMTDTLKRELPRMLQEHEKIRMAVAALAAAAKSEQNAAAVQLADDLALHAQTEEEVLYPAAILVGELLRARRAPAAGRE